MPKLFLITAANTDAGKTHITLLLLSALHQSGVRVGVVKAIETGVESIPLDGEKLHSQLIVCNSELSHLTIDDIVPIQMSLPAAPAVAKSGAISYEKIEQAIAKQSPYCDVLLIESAGGLFTPIDETTDVIDLATKFNATPIFIASDKLGMLSETTIHLNVFKERNLKVHWAVNLRGNMKDFDLINRPYLQTKYSKINFFQHDMPAFIQEIL
jgi:dethiobiotin synthetase